MKKKYLVVSLIAVGSLCSSFQAMAQNSPSCSAVEVVENLKSKAVFKEENKFIIKGSDLNSDVQIDGHQLKKVADVKFGNGDIELTITNPDLLERTQFDCETAQHKRAILFLYADSLCLVNNAIDDLKTRKFGSFTEIVAANSKLNYVIKNFDNTEINMSPVEIRASDAIRGYIGDSLLGLGLPLPVEVYQNRILNQDLIPARELMQKTLAGVGVDAKSLKCAK